MVEDKRKALFVVNFVGDVTNNSIHQFFSKCFPYRKEGKNPSDFFPLVSDLENTEILIALPHPYLHCLENLLGGSVVKLAAQGVDRCPNPIIGAVTGPMLTDNKVSYVMVGDPNLLQPLYMGGLVADASYVYHHNMVPIVLLHKNALDKDFSNKAGEVVKALQEKNTPEGDIERLVFAYHPAGNIQSSESVNQIQSMHNTIRSRLENRNLGGKIRIIYQGDVDVRTSAQLMGKQDIDGLVLNASMGPEMVYNCITKGIEARG